VNKGHLKNETETLTRLSGDCSASPNPLSDRQVDLLSALTQTLRVLHNGYILRVKNFAREQCKFRRRVFVEISARKYNKYVDCGYFGLRVHHLSALR
jgi:hypothetical protein